MINTFYKYTSFKKVIGMEVIPLLWPLYQPDTWSNFELTILRVYIRFPATVRRIKNLQDFTLPIPLDMIVIR